LLSIAITYAVTNVVLSFFSAVSLDLYASVYIVEYFIVTLLHSPLNHRTQRLTNRIGYALFSFFALMVVIKVLQIVGVSTL
jgi:hypothetical protein